MNRIVLCAVAGLCSVAAAQPGIAVVLDGDSDAGWIFNNGALQASFNTAAAGLGYPVAVRNTIWIGDRDNSISVEYDFNGVPTGNTAPGGGLFGQLLDGAAGDGVNYSVSCCGNDTVTVSDTQFVGETVLFGTGNAGLSSGIAFDPTTDTIYVNDFNGGIKAFDLAGNVLFSGSLTGGSNNFGGLAYNPATDSIWLAENGSSFFHEYNKSTFALLGSIDSGVNFGNSYGFEFAVPAPASIALLGFGGLVTARRRR